MSAINRPIPSQLDKKKVENMKTVLQIPERENELTPIVRTKKKIKECHTLY
jgi:sulfiredoxin